MSHKDRSIANMRCESKRIYNQRRYINKLEKDNKKLEQRIDKSILYIKNDLRSFLYSVEYKKLLEILKGDLKC